MGLFSLSVPTCKYSVMSAAAPTKTPSVQVYGRKKTATAVAHCKRGKGLIKVNGRPLEMMEPETLRTKIHEPVLLLGRQDLKELTSVSESREVVVLHKFTLSAKLLQSHSSPTTKSLLTKHPRRKLKIL